MLLSTNDSAMQTSRSSVGFSFWACLAQAAYAKHLQDLAKTRAWRVKRTCKKFSGKEFHWCITISFTDGTSKTFTVTNGKDGVGVASAAFNESGELVFTFTDGTQINLGLLPGSSIPTSGGASGERNGTGAAVPIALGAATVSLVSLLGWLIPLLRRKIGKR